MTLLAGLAFVVGAAPSRAATMSFGSPLSVPATQDTARNLNYHPAAGPAHDGSDTALWNVALASGMPTAPADGQILSIRLEGCAQPARGGPAPLTQIHFQDLVPRGGGAVQVNVTTQPFDIPVCGRDGASGSTVTTYQPTNFCVKGGDYVDFSDEGGFDPNYYSAGVPYQVIGSVPGSTMDSFIGNNQTNNGSTLSPSTTGATSGFATNAGEELLLQATLGSGPDATPLCSGGTAGQSPSANPGGNPGGGQPTPAAAVSLHRQTDGINRQRRVKVAMYCAQTDPCVGSVGLSRGSTSLGQASMNVPGRQTSHVPLRVSAQTVKLARKHHRRVSATLRVTLSSGQSFTAPVTLKV